MIDPGLTGQTAIVTEGNSGIGAAIVQSLAAEGAKVAIHYHPGQPDAGVLHAIPGESEADRLVDSIRAAGGAAVAVGADLMDLTDREAVARIFDAVEEALGPTTLLINNAAHCEAPDTLAEISAETLDRHFAVNTRAAVMLCQTLAARMEQRIVDGAVFLCSRQASWITGAILKIAGGHAL